MSDKIKYLLADAPERGFVKVKIPEPKHYDDGTGVMSDKKKCIWHYYSNLNVTTGCGQKIRVDI